MADNKIRSPEFLGELMKDSLEKDASRQIGTIGNSGEDGIRANDPNKPRVSLWKQYGFSSLEEFKKKYPNSGKKPKQPHNTRVDRVNKRKRRGVN